MTSNELFGATSPYLLQHRHNPVHWKQWSPNALEAAKKANKPILLSVGYAACHWCHVMAHESFEDESTADLMNRLFINIKVDREERPDIDQIYMTALHAMGEQGGWPLTMFLTPTGEAYWGGTYFPKTPAYGRPSFSQVLEAAERAYREEPAQIQNNVLRLRHAISEQNFQAGTAVVSDTMITELAKRLSSHMDREFGGIRGAPKFPNTQIVELFFRRAARTGIESFQHLAIEALRGMCRGGIRDHIGGGFARYSVDEQWFVPHFEKMLYDNAQILEQLCLAWGAVPSGEFRVAAEELVSWLHREMITCTHAFAASLDADSEGVEGKYYCWTLSELSAVLEQRELELLVSKYRFSEEGNWTEHHTGQRTNVVHHIGADIHDTDMETVRPIKRKLLSARNQRTPPARDDKILADWNGMMIAALARAGAVFGCPEWIDLGRNCFRFVIESMCEVHAEELYLAHSLRDGRTVTPAMSSDYVFLIRAALTLHDCNVCDLFTPKNGKPSSCLWLARQLARALLTGYADSETGLLSLARADASDVIYQHFSTTDDAIPNPNSVFLQSLQVLAALEDGNTFHEQAKKMISAITPKALENPFAHASFLNALDSRQHNFEIIITGTEGSLAVAAREHPFLSRIVIDGTADPEMLPARFSSNDLTPRAYVCRAGECSLPILTSDQLRDWLLMRKDADEAP